MNITSLEAALKYASIGLRVVPIAPGEKYPKLPEWQKAATTDPDTINAWWTGNYAGHGVGIALGELNDLSTNTTYVFAIDIDNHGDIDGNKMWDNVLNLEFETEPETVEAITGGGGRHLLYTSTIEIRNNHTLGVAAIDTRGEGGQIVVAPTIHPNGTQYQWAEGHAPWDRPITPAPEWLIKRLTKQRDHKPVTPTQTPERKALDGPRPGDLWAASTSWSSILTNDGWTLHHETSTEQHWTRPGKDTRDGTSATTGYSAADTLHVFTTSHPQLQADQNYTKLGYLATTQHNGDHTAAARALADLGWTTTTSTTTSSSPKLRHDNNTNPLLDSLIQWDTFWDMDVKPEWLLEPLFAQGRAHALFAGAKSGKSFVVLAGIAALTTGKPFLNMPAGTPKHVLYLDYEMTPEDLLDRLEGFGYGPDDDLTHLHYASLPHLPPLDTEEGGELLLKAAIDLRCEFVVIDTTSRAIEGEENESTTIRNFYRHTGLRLKQAGIGWVRLDHAGKDGAKGQRGTSAKNDDVDVVWKLARTDTGHVLEATHRRMSWVPEKVIVEVTDTDGITSFQIPTTAIAWPEGTADLAAKLDAAGVPLDYGSRRTRKEYSIVAADKKMLAALRYRKIEHTRREREATIDVGF